MANFTGTAGDDTFIGDAGSDLADGNGGNDSLSGGGGDSLSGADLAGNAGADTLDGGDGSDILYAGDRSPPFREPFLFYFPALPLALLDTGSDVDVIRGGAGNDRIFAGYGDYVDGGANAGIGDQLYISLIASPSGLTVDFEQPTLTIGGGTITGIEHVMWVQGSNFADTIRASGTTFGADGNDTLTAGIDAEALYGEAGNDVLDGRANSSLARMEGGEGNDTIYGATSGMTFILGNDGNDSIFGGRYISAGAGDDLVEVQQLFHEVYLNGNEGNDVLTIVASSVAGERNYLSGGAGADTLTGSARIDIMSSDNSSVTAPYDLGVEHDVLFAGDGDDMVQVGYGDDADGGVGSDGLHYSFAGATAGVTLDLALLTAGQSVSIGGGTIRNFEHLTGVLGTDFADSFVVGNPAWTIEISTGAGDDTVISSSRGITYYGEAGNDRLVSGSGADTFFAGTGFDIVDYSQYGAGISVDLEINPGSPGTGPDEDYIADVEGVIGSTFGDMVVGSGSNNELLGAGGNDTLSGEGGNDRLIGGEGHDNVMGGDGADTLDGGSGNDHLFGQSANGGTDSTDSLSGGGGSDYLQGNAGNDTLDGGDGSDRINGGANDDLIGGGSGNDTVNGNLGNDSIDGGSGNDSLRGGQGNDSISGGDGNDLVSGDLGVDTLTGGAGIDAFVFNGNAALFAGAAADIVSDFQDGTDRLHVGYAVQAVLKGSAASFSEAQAVAQALFNGRIGANEAAAVQVGGDTYLLYSSSNGGIVDSAVQLLNINAALIAVGDFA